MASSEKTENSSLEECAACGKRIPYDNISIVYKENGTVRYWCDNCGKEKLMAAPSSKSNNNTGNIN